MNRKERVAIGIKHTKTIPWKWENKEHSEHDKKWMQNAKINKFADLLRLAIKLSRKVESERETQEKELKTPSSKKPLK